MSNMKREREWSEAHVPKWSITSSAKQGEDCVVTLRSKHPEAPQHARAASCAAVCIGEIAALRRKVRA